MKEIEYKSPKSVEQTIEILNSGNSRARVLAGGTDLLVQLRERIRDADILVDVKQIPELRSVEQLPTKGWSIGAAVPCSKIEDHPEIACLYPSLADAVHIIGGWQIKNRATLGGNLCTSSPAGDSLPALVAHGAQVRIAGPKGERRVAIESFCTGPGRNVLEAGEFVVSFELPPAPPSSSGCYLRFIPRYEMDIAVVGVGASVTVEGSMISAARIGLGAVAPTPVVAEEASQWLVGQPATPETFAQAGQLSRNAARPISDMRGPAEYRVHLVGVLVARCLAIALRRIRGEQVNPLVDGHM